MRYSVWGVLGTRIGWLLWKADQFLPQGQGYALNPIGIAELVDGQLEIRIEERDRAGEVRWVKHFTTVVPNLLPPERLPNPVPIPNLQVQ